MQARSLKTFGYVRDPNAKRVRSPYSAWVGDGEKGYTSPSFSLAVDRQRREHGYNGDQRFAQKGTQLKSEKKNIVTRHVRMCASYSCMSVGVRRIGFMTVWEKGVCNADSLRGLKKTIKTRYCY